MKIAQRISLLFLPLLIVPVVLVAMTASRSARSGITSVARDFLAFKSEQLVAFGEVQYDLLAEHGLETDPEFVDASVRTIERFATGLLRSPTELIFALDENGDPAFATAELDATGLNVGSDDASDPDRDTEWQTLSVDDEPRVAYVDRLESFEWTVYATQTQSAFFSPVVDIARNSTIVTLAAAASAAVLIVLFSRIITQRITHISDAMRSVVQTGDLSGRVDANFRDETGDLAASFNSMTAALERAYDDVEKFAVKAATTRLREGKVRRVFQKYVPRQVVEEFFASPEAMLEGENRKLAVLFSDIRGFTSISESLSSQEVVRRLNRYFSRMVDLIMERQGVVDKYMGDGIMAFYGAPVPDDQASEHAVASAVSMLDAIGELNARSTGDSAIRVGFGISFGDVTVGNIGSERKMDYTVVGDIVNVASRLEGLTKIYHVPILFTDAVRERLPRETRCRRVDRVRVKGRQEALDTYTVVPDAGPTSDDLLELYNSAVDAYFAADFSTAIDLLDRARDQDAEDELVRLYLHRATTLKQAPPSDEWDGVTSYQQK